MHANDRRPPKPGFATRAIHAGTDGSPDDPHGALTPPVHMTSTFVFDRVAEGAARFAGEQPGHVYSRISNPTVDLLERRLASLEGGTAALATASGMGAITSLLWTLLSPGDEILADEALYGCTFAFLHHGLARFGVHIRHADFSEPQRVADAIGPATRVVYFETPANPTMRLVDIEAVAGAAHARGAAVVVDNTYATPVLTRPLEHGADFVVHSATKYLGGHGDLVAGAVIGPEEGIHRVRMEGLKDLTGAVMAPLTAHLVMRGLKTLELRMERHCRSAASIAAWLERQPGVASVHYPGLPSFPQRALAARQMHDFGGMIAFELDGGLEAGVRFMDSLGLIRRAVSLGDAESLIQHPASMTHSTMTPEERARHGIAEGLIRLSVGLETVEDLVGDLERALRLAHIRVA
ncbi:methionine gamma-lyase [Wenzhouxiangella sp. XN79A]|uniref:methionine gamma-lyase n=1 Tax=Wenzhouxiangella sp. XN79A TaxID=2724193 RepID=UPI00144AACCB|nr:methionine gamma-lyase [Wenzhouxiangella sp. XN79A]NKI34571.1 methionine gamma-lyase [Wenzhouxiangella sp. XN79A]